MSSKKYRNGLLEIYRLIIGFWVLFCHDFFFFENKGDIFSRPNLAADFFFVISGYFLLRSMQKLNDVSLGRGIRKLLFSRIKPMLCSMCFIAAFGVVCILLFSRDDIIGCSFFIFRYWWYILYFLIATVLFFLVYRLISDKWGFFVFLIGLAVFTTVLDYFVDEHGILIFELTFALRAFGCMSAGMLVSYIPKWKNKKFNFSIPIVAILFSGLVYLCYKDKTFLTCIIILALFSVLIYFTMNISLGGSFFDVIGLLGLRMYLYISFVSTLYILGLTNHRVLFIINVTAATLDLLFTLYKNKYKSLYKRKSQSA